MAKHDTAGDRQPIPSSRRRGRAVKLGTGVFGALFSVGSSFGP